MAENQKHGILGIQNYLLLTESVAVSFQLVNVTFLTVEKDKA